MAFFVNYYINYSFIIFELLACYYKIVIFIIQNLIIFEIIVKFIIITQNLVHMLLSKVTTFFENTTIMIHDLNFDYWHNIDLFLTDIILY